MFYVQLHKDLYGCYKSYISTIPSSKVGEKLECVESAKRIGKLLKAEKRVVQQKNFEEVTVSWTQNDFESRRKQAVTACLMQSFFAVAAMLLVIASLFYTHISINQVIIGFGCFMMFGSFALRSFLVIRMLAEKRIMTIKDLYGL